MEAVLSIPIREKKITSDGVMGMIFLLAAEAMFFAGLISAYIVNRAGAVWPPYGQPRLPVEVTAINSVILIASAITIYFSRRKLKSNLHDNNNSLKLLAITIVLGVTFLAIQGTEWVKLISYGLTTRSSLYGAFFYTVIGAHAVHVFAGLLVLFYLFYSLKSNSSFEISKIKIAVCSMYWYFVVTIWPILYVLVYLI